MDITVFAQPKNKSYVTGLAPPSFSATRWWSRFEVMHQLFKAFGDVTPFLENPDMTSSTSTRIMEIINDPAKISNYGRCNGTIRESYLYP